MSGFLKKRLTATLLLASAFFLLFLFGCATTEHQTYFGKPDVPEEQRTLLVKPEKIAINYMDIAKNLPQQDKLLELFRQMKIFGVNNNRAARFSLEAGEHDISVKYVEHYTRTNMLGGTESDDTATDSMTIHFKFEAGKTYVIRWEPVKTGDKIRIWIEPLLEGKIVPAGEGK